MKVLHFFLIFVLFVLQIFENSHYQISGTNLQEQQEKKITKKAEKQTNKQQQKNRFEVK
jgi:hypothetical protein